MASTTALASRLMVLHMNECHIVMFINLLYYVHFYFTYIVVLSKLLLY